MLRSSPARTPDSTQPRRRGCRLQLETLEGRALLAAGALDTTFGGTGKVVTQLAQKSFIQGVAVQADLKTVVAGLEAAGGTTGMFPYSLAVLRYDVDGSLDPTFGSGGKVVLATNTVKPSFALHNTSVAVQPNGEILVATDAGTFKTTTTGTGTNATTTTVLTSCDMLVLRLNADGTLDTTFGQGGKTTIHLAQGSAVSAGIAVLPSGQIVVAGTDDISSLAGPTFVVARLTSSGTLDSTFGPNGQGYNFQTVAAAGTSPKSAVNAMAMDASGNILLGGSVPNPSGSGPWVDRIVRYTPGGLVDATFATQGIFSFSTGGIWGAEGVGFQPTGQIIAVRNSYNGVGTGGVTRLSPNGTIDTNFGTNGTFTDPSQTGAAEVAVQLDGKILFQFVSLDSSGSPYSDIRVDRLLADGTLDATFGTGGQVEMHGNHGAPEGILVGPDNKITGTQAINTTPLGFETFRLLNDSTLKASRFEGRIPSTLQGSQGNSAATGLHHRKAPPGASFRHRGAKTPKLDIHSSLAVNAAQLH